MRHIAASEGLDAPLPEGAFYVFPSCAGLIGKISGKGKALNTDNDVCDALLDEAHVAVVPGTAFGSGPAFRISYATSDEVLEQAGVRIAEFCASAR